MFFYLNMHMNEWLIAVVCRMCSVWLGRPVTFKKVDFSTAEPDFDLVSRLIIVSGKESQVESLYYCVCPE